MTSHGIKRILANEGILSANSIPIQRGQKVGRSLSNIINQTSYECNFLVNSQWIPLGEGWFQVTREGSGKSSRVGLHSVIEAEVNQLYMCIFEPKSTEAFTACTSKSPEYDLEISIKSMVKSVSVNNKIGNILQNINKNNSNNSNIFHVILSYKSSSDWIAIICDINSLKWTLIQKKDINTEILLAETADPSLRSNIFYTLLVQIRGRSISVDLNNKPLFTTIRIKDLNDNLSGLAGIATPASKIAIKSWKLRGVSSTIGISGNSNKSIVSSKNGRATPSNDNRFQSLSKLVIENEQLNEYDRSVCKESSNAGKSKSLAEALNSMNLHNESSHKQNTAEISNVFTRVGAPLIPLGGGGPGTKLPTAPIPNDKGDFMLTSNSQKISTLYDRHDRNLVDNVMRDIVQTDLGITFDNIASLETAKRLLSEAIVLPLVMPEFFIGIRKPWSGVLLFGPPGTGKTLLAKAVCGFSNSTFFNCSASSLISKYRGESEKLVRVLFEAAHLLSPAVVFLDEVDALVSARREDEHEASRRLKTEFFSQMDGIHSGGTDHKTSSVMVLATTNCPWDLDEAMRRRLEKRIYIPLPDDIARLNVFQISLKDIPLSNDVNFNELATVTEGYSGADIHVVCREASMMPMRRLLAMLSPKEIQDMRQNGELVIPKVLQKDILLAIGNTKPSVSKEILIRYAEFEREYGSH